MTMTNTNATRKLSVADVRNGMPCTSQVARCYKPGVSPSDAIIAILRDDLNGVYQIQTSAHASLVDVTTRKTEKAALKFAAARGYTEVSR